jgi:hypothetical protein
LVDRISETFVPPVGEDHAPDSRVEQPDTGAAPNRPYRASSARVASTVMTSSGILPVSATRRRALPEANSAVAIRTRACSAEYDWGATPNKALAIDAVFPKELLSALELATSCPARQLAL